MNGEHPDVRTSRADATDGAPAAVLWDLDGTLVDTEPYWIACERELVATYGGEWTEEDARSIIGFDLIDAAVVLRDRGGVDMEPHAIVEWMLDGVIARVRAKVPWRPGARRLLSELNALGVPCALVTMSWRRLVDVDRRRARADRVPGRGRRATTSATASRTREPYRTAAARLGVDPTACVAIEDSPPGIDSATAAGCVVVAVPNIVAIEPAPGRIVVDSLKSVTPDDLGTFLATAPAPVQASPNAPPDHGRRRALAIGGGLLAAVAVVAIAAAVVGRGDDVPPRAAGTARPPSLDAVLGDRERPARARRPRSDTLHALSPLWYRATGADSIEVDPNTPADQAAKFIATARRRGVPIVASVLDGTKADVMAGILADPAQRARHVAALATFAATDKWAGIDLDYEQFAFADGRDTWAATRPNWVAFVSDLAARLHADGRTLTVSIPPVFDGGQTGTSGYWVYDYAAITPLVDTVRVMAYDYSVASGSPGPIAPLSWVDAVIAATARVSGDPSKLVLGIPLYGYNWVVATSGTCPPSAEGNISLSTREMTALAARRKATPTFDKANYEMTFSYELPVSAAGASCTQSREVRYVDANGAQIRMQHAVDGGFGGVSLFAFGYEDAATWTAIDTIAAQLQPVATTTPPG